MLDFLLSTKIHIPPVHGNLVSRPRLIQHLNDGLAHNHRLTLISAPAGYGKSTLLSEWISQVDVPAAWLSLDQGDNTPARFWSYFVAALDSVPDLSQAGVGEPLLQSLQSGRQPSMEKLLARLLNDLSQLNKRLLLVLDDLHVITDSQIHHDLGFLVDRLPGSVGGLHLVVASRMDPPWPLARWRVRGELTELRTKDMRFSPEEATAFLNDVMGLKLAAGHIAILDQRTEGRIAGLLMAALSMQGRGDVAGFLEGFSGSHRFVLDYLLEEVLSQQTPETLNFLLQTSVLQHLTAPLCDAITRATDSQDMLGQLERSNMFLVPLDEERSWYRYHHLFADLLRKRLKQTRPERITELHQHASEWYAENNFLAEAISHALQAGDVALVNKFVAGNALAMAEHAELQDVLLHFEQMPEDQICARPWLCVAYVWVKAYNDPSGEIDQILIKAMQSVNGVEDALERQHLTSHLDAVWAYLAWVKGKPDVALDFVHTALENLPSDDWITRNQLLNIEGLALQYLDYLPEAIQSFEAAVAAGQRTGRPYESFNAYTNWAYAEILRGRLHQAYSLCQHVLSLADQSGLLSKGLPVLAYAYATLSVVQREWNQLEAAVASARQSLVLAEQWKQADTLHFTLTCLAEALAAAGDLGAAFAANQRALQLGLNVSPWFFHISAFDEVLLNLAKGDLSAAAHRFADVEPTVEPESRSGQFLVTKASLLTAQGCYSDALTAIDQSISKIEQKDKRWVLIRLLTLQALAFQGLGRTDEALAALDHCLSLAAPEGFVYNFVQTGAPMHRLLQVASQRGIHAGYINTLLPCFELPAAPVEPAAPAPTRVQPIAQAAPLLEPLSERELQVLRLLDSPLTSEAIGRELYISTNTVRTHIKNIYAKLGVNRRVEAVQLAKKIKLM